MAIAYVTPYYYCKINKNDFTFRLFDITKTKFVPKISSQKKPSRKTGLFLNNQPNFKL